ncbi:MAG: tetrahydromethanopterin S-methyltransferase subunit C [Candidatus Azotimanducaceae bacterium]|jgi:tetrahydromethanopterin S-methyltransferase subunit C
MIGVATTVNLMVTWKRNMREFALVGAWALIAIAAANTGSYETIKIVAYVAAGVLILSSTIHAFKNRNTNPAMKCLQYLKGTKS